MNKRADDLAMQTNLLSRALELPLVSFIVVNYNYSRFLGDCVRSIMKQDYPSVECIVIDNASTDGFARVMEDLVADHHQIQFVANATNVGQTLACQQGFALSSGLYVSFIDADDFLLPDYAKTHIAVHFSVSDAVAFTSANMIEFLNETALSSSCINGTLKSMYSTRLDPAASLTHALRETWPFLPSVADLEVRMVHPDNIHWVWGPTTSSMYRRDALDLFIPNPSIGKLKLSTDAYLNFGLSALCGSLLIDRPLSVYRIHGDNNFAKSGQLRNLLNYDEADDYGCFAAYCALEHILDHFGLFFRRAVSPRILGRAMRTLARKSKSQSGLGAYLRPHAERLIRFYWSMILRSVLPRRR